MDNCLKPTKDNTARAAVVLLLIFNIAVAVFIIQAFGSHLNGKSSNGKQQMKWTLDLEKAYRKYSTKKIEDEQQQNQATTDTKPSLEFLSLLKPVAHFSGLDFENNKDTKKLAVPIRNWANSEGSERTLCYNDMTYKNGSITVPAAGVYHITSHVKFYVEDNRKNDNSSQTFHHQIVRYSASSGKQVVLFENVLTECREGINDGAHLEYPSLTGGLAQLDAGDHVIVRVSHFDLLKHDRDWHYFDMYLI